MQQPYSYSREQPVSSSASENRCILSARRHLFIMRHSMACRDRELEGNRRQCSYPVCAQMRRVLDHVIRCDLGTECTVEYCVTSKRLQTHAGTCTNPSCMVCRDPPYPQVPNNQHFVNDGFQAQPNSETPVINGFGASLYQQASENTSVEHFQQDDVRNGFDWRTSYSSERRNHLIKKYAEQVFPPVTFCDARAATVVKCFQDEENKIFSTCRTELQYLDELQRFSNRIRDHITRQMGNSTLLNSNKRDTGNPLESKSGAPPVINNIKECKEPGVKDCESEPKVEASSLKPIPSADVAIKEEETKLEPHEPVTTKDMVRTENDHRYVWTKNELIAEFIPLISEISKNEPCAEPFLFPVDHEKLRLLDYLNVIEHPMDISTIENKLKTGEYSDPWEIVDHFWLMFNNAWKYNKKNSKVYKFCSKLAEKFENLIDPIMEKLGFCCGREFVHYPHVLACATEKSCNINRDAVYYVYDNSGDNKKKNLWDKYIVCEKCYLEANEKVAIDDPNAPLFLDKSLFEKQRNNNIVREEFVICRECGRKWHKVCACHMDEIWSSGYVCKTCINQYNLSRAPNRFTSKTLPSCKLSEFLENRVNSFMKRNESQANEVTIRVLASANKSVEVKKFMRKNFSSCGKFPESFPYRVKVLFAFQEHNGQEVCFFGLHVQEYSSDCPAPNTRRVYIAYLDSVYFFEPRQFRTKVYHEILVGYLRYAKLMGFATAHIWACPPIEGDDYIFHMHPADQKIPKPKRLQEWYQTMLKSAHNDRIVVDYNNIHQDACDIKCLTPTELPYFEGDFWPNTLEELFRAVEETRRKLREEEDVDEVGDDMNDDGDSNHGSFDSDRKPGSAGSGGGAKKKTKKRKMKRTTSALSIAGGGSKRKRLMAATCDTEAEVQRRLDEMLQRNAESFLTINLYPPSQVTSLKPIEDPDPLFSSEMMECRDAFLSRARERHLEFSTLRRAKFSTLAMLYDVHTENKDVYYCNHCQREFAFPLQCKQCPNFHLCEACYNSIGHKHPMNREDSVSNATVQLSVRTKMELSVRLLEHACTCRDANCRVNHCRLMRSRMAHFPTQHDRTKCIQCRQLHKILAAHSNKCNNLQCPVAYCEQYKSMKKKQELQQRLRKAQTLRRRQKNMQRYNSKTPQQPTTPQPLQAPNSNAAAPLPPSTQLIGQTASPTVSQSTPNSSEPPHSFCSQTSITSPHSVSNSRNSPAKPSGNTQVVATPHPAAAVSGAPLPASLQYSHPSPYHQPHPQPPISSGAPVGAVNSRPGSVHMQQNPSYHSHLSLAASGDYQPTIHPTASPYAVQQQQQQLVQQQVYQQQQAQMMQQRSPTPQMMAAAVNKAPPAAVDIAFARQNSNPSAVMSSSAAAGFYENGQMMGRVPHSRMSYTPQMPNEIDEAASAGDLQVSPYGTCLKRQAISDSEMLQGTCDGNGGNMYAGVGGSPMLQRSMSAAAQKPIHRGGVPLNGQVPMGPMSPQMVQTRPQPQPQQTIQHPAQSQSISLDDVRFLQEAHSKLPEAEFSKFLQQRPQLFPAFNFLRHQQQQHQMKQQQQIAQQQQYLGHQQPMMVVRGNMANPGYYTQNNVPRMVHPGASGGSPMGNAWSATPQQQQQQQMPQAMDQRTYRPAATCYAPAASGKPVYGQQQPQQVMPGGGAYALPGCFPSRYPSPMNSGVPMTGDPMGVGAPGRGVQMAQRQQQRLPTPVTVGNPPTMSPRVPIPPYLHQPQQQQHPPSQLSQLLGQPQQGQPPQQQLPGGQSRPPEFV